MTLLLVSCTTVPKKTNSELDLAFPRFPDPVQEDGTTIVVYDVESDSVSMPLWYWKKITRYVLFVDETEKIYDSYKESVLETEKN